MNLSRSIPLTIGIVLSLVAVIVIAGAMFAVDQGEEMLHLYKDYQASQRPKNRGPLGASPTDMELRGSWMGLSVAEVGGPTAAALGVPPQQEHGLVIAGFAPEKAQLLQQVGLRPGDVITGVDGQPIKNLANLHRQSHVMMPGTPVMLDVQRQGQVVTLVLPAQQPAPAMQAALAGPQYYCPRDGLLVPGAAQPGGTGLCPRCSGPLHLYNPGAQAAMPAYGGLGNVGLTAPLSNGWAQ